MTLAPHTRLGPYEILAPLGAGGMGEVYRARDTRLDRSVAVKVLPQGLAATPDARARFEREARAISQLNHPHICVLHDVGHQDGVDYLVMELLEGETLAARLSKGALPVPEVLKLGAQIADALDRAHRQGLVHRDLKPGNVMLTRSGAKLLDFGLARAAAPAVGAGGQTRLPTRSEPLTGEGSIVGTFQYMAPEQLEGKEADGRSDIWALGATLYEMATGTRAFEGQSAASLISAIMRGEPRPLAELQPMSPPGFERAVKQCLAKDPDERWQSAGDLKRELEWIAHSGSQAGAAGAPARRATAGAPWAWAAGGAALAIAVTLVAVRTAPRTAAPLMRTMIPPPGGAHFFLSGDEAGPPTLSPDGTKLAFVAVGQEEGSQIWVRPLATLRASPLPGTEGASYPFWSPDGRSIGFYASGRLKRLDLEGGSVITLCAASLGRGATWGRNGVIVFSPDIVAGLYQVPAAGGEPRSATSLDTTRFTTHRWPQFLPDGKRFLYLAAHHDTAGGAGGTVFLGSLDGRPGRPLLASQGNAVYASGHLLVVQDSTLLAYPFDVRRGRVTGPPRATAEVVQFDRSTWKAVLSASDNGLLAYAPGSVAGGYEVRVHVRSGRTARGVSRPGNHLSIDLSPDGSRFVLETQDLPSAEVWVYDPARASRIRVTHDPADDTAPVWSADGNSIYFASNRGAPTERMLRRYRIWRAPSGTLGEPRMVVEGGEADAFPEDCSADGRYLLFSKGFFSWETGPVGSFWLLPLDGGGAARLVADPRAALFGASLSPDGRWLAYSSAQSGKPEVYVVPAAATGGAVAESSAMGGALGEARWQISTEGGMGPRWRADGRELFYRRPDNMVVAAQVDGRGPAFRVVGEETLFRAIQRVGPSTYDVSRDGQTFYVVVRGAEDVRPLVLVSNWTAELKGR